MVTVDAPSTEVEESVSIPLIVFTASSIRLVMSVSTSSADAPGLLTETDTVGKSILGNRSTPRVKNEKVPTTMRATMSMVAKTGRLTQSSASLCTDHSPSLEGNCGADALVRVGPPGPAFAFTEETRADGGVGRGLCSEQPGGPPHNTLPTEWLLAEGEAGSTGSPSNKS